VFGTTGALIMFLSLLERIAPEYGLEVNPAKCEFVSVLSALPPGLRHTKLVSSSAWELLGVPLGSAEHRTSSLKRLAARLTGHLKSMARLTDTRTAYLISRFCLTFGPAVHLMRAFGHDTQLELLDGHMQDLCEPFIGSTNALQWELCTLPVKDGGLGMRPCAPIAALAHTASIRAATPTARLLRETANIDPVNSAGTIATCPWLSRSALCGAKAQILALTALPPPPDASEQRAWTAIVDAYRIADWESRAPDTIRARRSSASAKFASAWLWGVGCDERRVPGMSSAQFNTCISLRVGRPVFALSPEGYELPCGLCSGPSPKKLDVGGNHALSCTGRGCRTALHNAIAREITDMARIALLQPQREVRAFVGKHDHLRVDLVFRSGRPTTLDVAVTHPFGDPHHTQVALRTPGGAATAYEKVKVSKYGEASTLAGFRFVPLIVDTLGAWGDNAIPTLSYIGRHSARHYREHPNYALQLAMARLSVVMQRSIADIVTTAGLRSEALASAAEEQVFSGCDPRTTE
jgi:hypothetical protein